jgi:uncharacterized protein YndB with AHSA1/START domain
LGGSFLLLSEVYSSRRVELAMEKTKEKGIFGDFVQLLQEYFSTEHGNHDGVSGHTWREGRHFICHNVAWVRVPPETAFAYIADITRHNEWAMDEITVKPRTPGSVHLGSEFASVGRQGGKDWPSHLIVTKFDPPWRFEFTATGGPIAGSEADPHRHEFVFFPENGGTRIEVFKIDPAPGKMPTWLVWSLIPIGRISLGKRYKTIQKLQTRLNQLDKKV